jgi:hypothetical protein
MSGLVAFAGAANSSASRRATIGACFVKKA